MVDVPCKLQFNLLIFVYLLLTKKEISEIITKPSVSYIQKSNVKLNLKNGES